ncbi:class I SAM-dependent methyltransferase [Chitinophaga nivalis]|uniref:Class I SAM-dependent methyltransferase n=1 Tax=Chitinophaga nivalis TaxID=2991709 RepID=A0ABT3IGH6_9BACT|nr:class I SAM-dependent methyltransferase [Chitinophaga nivalis]MCW3467236.1 class I SAM-dependent methyltransferase [Chitinophaga nivalis]MCW3483072.1 class I SAM-dependent methyltransferase [Chitinophaga nivalis]
MTYKLKVPSTSRFILEYALDLYTTPLQQHYIDAIDFSETSRIAWELRQAYPTIPDAIYYRKLSIREMFREQLLLQPQQQVIILGAGLDPLSLYLLENYKNNIKHIFEVDNGYIFEKKAIYEELLPGQKSIHFIRCDLTDTQTLAVQLVENGYNAHLPTLIIFEGVIHFITNEEFINLMLLFKTNDQRNIVTMDYFLTTATVPPAFKTAHSHALTVLETYINGALNTNSRDNILALLAALGASGETVEPLNEIEYKTTGSNHVFHVPGEGMLEMVLFHI